MAGGYSKAGYATATRSGISRQGLCATGRMFGSPKIAVNEQGQVYLAFRDVTNNDALLLYQAGQEGNFSRLAGPGQASTFDLAAGKEGLLLAFGGSFPELKQLEGDTWKTIARLDQPVHEPRLATGDGSLFLLAAPNGASSKNLRVYRLAGDSFLHVGDPVDKNGNAADLTVFDGRLFTAYRTDGKARIRFNAPADTTDALLSLSVTPPNQLSYLQGESVSTRGMQVFANYTSGPRELAPAEYALTGFDSTQPGQRQATVSHQGLTASFPYTVFERPIPTAVPTAVPTAQPTAEPTAQPTAVPTAQPTVEPTAQPTAVPTAQSTAEPTAQPTAVPTAQPTVAPTVQPAASPAEKAATPPAAQPAATSIPATPAPEATVPPSSAVIRPARPTTAPSPTPAATPTAAPTEQPTITPSPSPAASASSDVPAGKTAGPSAAPFLLGLAGLCVCGGLALLFFKRR